LTPHPTGDQRDPKDKYSKLDANANGVIEPDEFDALVRQREPPL